MKSFSLLLLGLLVFGVPALADVSISSPTSGSKVVSPFLLTATASSCSSQPVGAIGYSIDSGNLTIFKGSSINTRVSSITGAHTVNVAAYGREGAVCPNSVAIIVVSDPTTSVPSGASIYSAIQALSGWQGTNDSGVQGGEASGTTKIVSSPSLSGSARQFSMQYANYGAERYWAVFGSNSSATNFLYDGWVYIARLSHGIANLEMDTDQVLSNGDTVILGFQCDGFSGTWDYTENAGTPKAPQSHWLNSQYECNPREWTIDTWHHVQVTYSRDQFGSVTYGSVWFDGVEQDINETVPSDYSLNWAIVLLTNFQIDGYGSKGSATVYLDMLTIYAW